MKNTLRAILLSILMSLGLIACSHLQTKDASALQTPVLTEEIARQRASRMSNVHYELLLDISQGTENYSGSQLITFNLKETQSDVYLDFQGGTVAELRVNNSLTPIVRGPVFLLLPKASLTIGFNSVKIQFQHEYSHSGVGLHQFVDPEDKKIYLYTQFEPFDANRFAPFFDQPDLKAKLKLTVLAPKEWEVIANTAHETKTTHGQVAEWHFAETAPISTYLFALIAGPYAKWSDRYNNIPLRLFARKSLAKYVNAAEWFKITKQGLGFYEKYFATPYAFGKYDQLIVPEFNAGAMENAGAVTFSEKFIKRGGYTRPERLHMYNVVLHEMAHQWFGDLVTMVWWNDLWLNESFATYMAALSQSRATEFSEAWMEFREDKLAAYKADVRITTHPISGEIKNSNDAFMSFDDITYGKGAAVLKELSFYVGQEQFQKSVQQYFKDFSFQNATLRDFISSFEKVKSQDMKPWFKNWLETTGVDEVTQSYACDANGDINVKLLFHNKSHKPHAFKVAKFSLQTGSVRPTGHAILTVPAEELEASMSIKSQSAEKCPDFIYANYDDNAYVKLNLDEKSLIFLKEHINEISDANLKIVLWADLWQMVRENRLSVRSFKDIALKGLEVETDNNILKFLAARTTGSFAGETSEQFDSVYYYFPRETESDRKEYSAMKEQVESVLHNRLEMLSRSKISMNKDLFQTLNDMYIIAAHTPPGLSLVAKFLKTSNDPDRRWLALKTLCRENYTDVKDVLKTEKLNDSSDKGHKNSLACEALIPDANIKGEFLKKLNAKSSNLTSDETEEIAKHLFSADQRNLILPFHDEIYTSMLSTWLSRSETDQANLSSSLSPVACLSEASSKLKTFLEKNRNLPATVRRPLLEIYDEDQRCITVRKQNSENRIQ